jgi:hypothetical protein
MLSCRTLQSELVTALMASVYFLPFTSFRLLASVYVSVYVFVLDRIMRSTQIQVASCSGKSLVVSGKLNIEYAIRTSDCTYLGWS